MNDYSFQDRASEELASKDASYLDAKVGMGKTKISIQALCLKYISGEVKEAYVFLPPPLIETWKVELKKWSTVPFEVMAWKRTKAFKNFFNGDYCHLLKIVLIPYSLLSTDTARQEIFKAMRSRRDFKKGAILDEAHFIKGHKSQRTKGLLHLSDMFCWKVAMSGTPCPQNILDLYTQYLFLDEGILGYKSWYQMRNKHCVMGGFGGKQIKEVVGVSKVVERIAPSTCVLDYDKVGLELPPRVYEKIYTKLSPKVSEIYKRVKETSVLLVNAEISGEEKLLSAMNLSNKLLQLSCGFAKNYNDEGDNFLAEKSEKEEALKYIIENTEGKIVVWSSFILHRQLLREAFERHKIPYADFTEGKDEAKKVFEEDPNIKVLLMSQGMGAEGLTLNVAKTSIFADNKLMSDKREQAEGRNYRIGQKDPVKVYDIVSQDTVEEKYLRSLSDKIAFRELLREALLTGDIGEFYGQD